jgi:membrane-bound lytic murein transglycosylase MltF
MTLDYLALVITMGIVALIVCGSIAIWGVPYQVAKARNHPRQDAIDAATRVRLFALGVFWPFFWIWARRYRPDRDWVSARARSAGEIRMLKSRPGTCFVALAVATIGISSSEAAPRKKATALPETAIWVGDFDGMQKRLLIRIIVPYSKTIYFVDKAQQLGVAAKLGQELEKWLNKGVTKEIQRVRVAFIPTPRDKLLSALNEGRGDVVAANLTITPERLRVADFTTPGMRNVRELLVTGSAAPPIAKLEDLAGQDLYLRKSSSYREHLEELNAKWQSQGLKPIRLRDADEHLEDEDLMEMVSAGLLPYAVVDDHKATIWAKVFQSLTVRNDIAISEGGEIGWAIRKNSPLLKARLDLFVEQHMTKANSLIPYVLQKYYRQDKMVRRAYAPENMKRFEELVAYFTRYGDQYRFDHLMILAQGYQESELNQKLRSRAGAVGVMQLLPSTARTKEVNIAGVETSAERNIEAGNKYLRHLIQVYINDPSLDAKNQTLFAFAAHNAGPNNLKKFRARAKAVGLDPNIWFDNVENAAAAIIGRETVQYVSNIYKYYIAYMLAAERQAEAQGARQGITSTKRPEKSSGAE